MNTTSDMVIGQLQRVINKILFLKKKRLFEFQGVVFYPSEVHLMLAIKDGMRANATRIAGRLGVTKGAVSQTLARLEKKGIVKKTKDPYKKNELALTFTPFGAKALEHYRTFATDLFGKHKRHLDGLTDDDRAVIQRFLIGVEGVFEEML